MENVLSLSYLNLTVKTFLYNLHACITWFKQSDKIKKLRTIANMELVMIMAHWSKFTEIFMFGIKGKELPHCCWNHENSDALVVQIGD